MIMDPTTFAILVLIMIAASASISIVLVKFINKVVDLPTKVDVSLAIVFTIAIAGFLGYSML